jgi:hypothetical protein
MEQEKHKLPRAPPDQTGAVSGLHGPLRWRKGDSNCRSLSLDSREEAGPEVDRGGIERRSPFSQGDQRFESPSL